MSKNTVNIAELNRYLEAHVEGFKGLNSAEKFAGGQSNVDAPCWSSAQPCAALLCQLQLSGWQLGQEAARGRQSRMACGRAVSPRRLHRHQPVPPRRAGGGLLQ